MSVDTLKEREIPFELITSLNCLSALMSVDTKWSESLKNIGKIESQLPFGFDVG